jgi:ribosome recycling factor
MFDFAGFERAAEKILLRLKEELAVLRTGGANPQLLDSVKVEAYGTMMRVTELAVISVRDPTLLVVTPWDAGVIGAIEKAIQQANLNLNPVVEGKIIRISVPALTNEGRENLVKILRQKIEEGKVMLRNLRGEIKKEIEAQKGKTGISEDEIENNLVKLEEKVKEVVKQIEDLAKEKESKLLKV